MECDIIVIVRSVKHNSGGHTSVDSVEIKYGDYNDLKDIAREVNNHNYSNVSYVKKAFIKTLDLEQLK